MEHLHDYLVIIFKNVHLPLMLASYLHVHTSFEDYSDEHPATGDNFPSFAVNNQSPVSHGKCRL